MHVRDGLQTHVTVRQRYDHLVESGSIRSDQAQLPIVAALDRLIDEISEKRLARKSSALGWLFARRKPQHEHVKGLYIHGGVGRGKTMLMDMFFAAVPVERKRRSHFNDFMADVHDRIHEARAGLARRARARTTRSRRWRRARPRGPPALLRRVLGHRHRRRDDPVAAVLRAVCPTAWCWSPPPTSRPTTSTATGSTALFLPFIGMLEQNTNVLNLDADTDYRLEKLDRVPVYISPLGEAADKAMDKAWARMTHGAAAEAATVAVKGRKVAVPAAVPGCARFGFADLCEKPLAARDYLAITAHYKTIFVDHVPVLAEANRNEAKRFILLVDTLYDQQIRLVISAAATPDKLYVGKRGHEAFEFDRTSSRLIEMQGAEWLDSWAERHAEPAASLAG
jgi:cell division protein ZapE